MVGVLVEVLSRYFAAWALIRLDACLTGTYHGTKIVYSIRVSQVLRGGAGVGHSKYHEVWAIYQYTIISAR